MTSFAIIGGGWRAEFFLRIAQALPDRFRVEGMVVRDAAKGERLERLFGVRTHRNLDALLAGDRPPFVVVSVPWTVAPVMLEELASRRIAALCETPPAPDVPGLVRVHELVRRGARIQVAEQYALQPLHAARLHIVRSGLLGRVTQAQVSAAHGYHGISFIRQLLGVTFEEATIRAMRFSSPITAGPGRAGPPTEEKITTSIQTIAWIEFGDRLGVYDFTGDQYFSWIRSQRVLVRGDRGEIHNTHLRYLADFRTPIEIELIRSDAGQNSNLEGYYHKGYLAGSEWVYRNPFVPGRLSDDEIAVATMLEGMGRYVEGGPEVYPLALAAQDRYLDILIEEAAQTGQKVQAVRQAWAG